MLGLRSWWATAMNREEWRKLLKEAKSMSCSADDDDDDDDYLYYQFYLKINTELDCAVDQQRFGNHSSCSNQYCAFDWINTEGSIIYRLVLPWHNSIAVHGGVIVPCGADSRGACPEHRVQTALQTSILRETFIINVSFSLSWTKQHMGSAMLSVCTCVRMCVCLYVCVCMYVCVYVYMYVCKLMHVCMYARI
jgi:hypothetical protein